MKKGTREQWGRKNEHDKGPLDTEEATLLRATELALVLSTLHTQQSPLFSSSEL